MLRVVLSLAHQFDYYKNDSSGSHQRRQPGRYLDLPRRLLPSSPPTTTALTTTVAAALPLLPAAP